MRQLASFAVACLGLACVSPAAQLDSLIIQGGERADACKTHTPFRAEVQCVQDIAAEFKVDPEIQLDFMRASNFLVAMQEAGAIPNEQASDRFEYMKRAAVLMIRAKFAETQRQRAIVQQANSAALMNLGIALMAINRPYTTASAVPLPTMSRLSCYYDVTGSMQCIQR